jgi:group I intron endonuclease
MLLFICVVSPDMNKEKILSLPPIMVDLKMRIKWDSKISGIYAWVNAINGKMYIGRSVNLYKRIYDEMNGFQNGKDQNMIKLFRAIQKYGIKNFRVIRLLECPPNNLNRMEQLLIEYYDTKKNGYNCTLGGDGTHGHKVTQEQIKKQRESLKKYWSEERKITHSDKMKRWANDESRKEHLIEVGREWRNNPLLLKKQIANYRRSLTSEKIERQRASLNRHYQLHGGKSVRYKEIVAVSPTNELIRVTNVKSFCQEHDLGRVGFYEFVRRNDTTNSFRGWKVVSKVV